MSRAVVDAKEFSHAMSKISKILKKCAIPILEEVCLRIQNGRCTLTATDLETWLTTEFPASGDDMFFAFRKTKDIQHVYQITGRSHAAACAAADH